MNQHDGEIPAKEGYLELTEDSAPVSGKVVVDLTKMVNHDIPDKSLAAGLIGHLASADFFDVENYPEASFELKSAEPISGATYGVPNYAVSGTLSAVASPSSSRSMRSLFRSRGASSFNPHSTSTALSSERSTVPAVSFERPRHALGQRLVSMDIAAFFTVTK